MTSDVAERDDSEPRRRVGPFTFAKEVRAESRKITWASRQETLVSTIFVLIMVIAAAAFFFLVDSVIQIVIQLLLQLAT